MMKPNNSLALVMLSVATLVSYLWFPAIFVYISGILLIINAIISILMREISVIPILILAPSGLLYVEPWNLGFFVGLAMGCLVGYAWKYVHTYHRPERRDFFLSYKTHDANLVRQVAECLVSNGFSVWFAEYEILLPNYKDFQVAIDHGLENCTYGILFTNPRYWSSPHCQDEAARLRKNLGPERVFDISLTTSTTLPNIISDISSRINEKLNCMVPQIASETIFSARCTEIGFSTTGFCLEQWTNASEDGTDEARFRSLDPDFPLRFNVRFDFNLEYPLEMKEMKDIKYMKYTRPDKLVAVDRKLYWHLLENIKKERRDFAEWWMKEMDTSNTPLVEEGLHIVWREQSPHIALTHRYANHWMRKYSLIIDGPGLARSTEIVFTFDIQGDFRRFCTATVLMDSIVESVHITNESSKTTTVKCTRR